MRILLDTHVWLWTLVSPDRIRPTTRTVLEDTHTDLYLSAASSWEIGIKYSLGKLPLPEPPEQFILPRLLRDRIESLPIDHRHAVAAAALPDHHRDPFDRMLIAQARAEGLTICTADGVFERYEVPILRA